MRTRNTVITGLLSFLFLISFASAQTILNETGSNFYRYYDTQTKKYTVQIFINPINVYENGKWVYYQNAKSLKYFWQVKVLKSDKGTPLEVLDYNYTHLVLSIGSNKTGQVPFTWCKDVCPDKNCASKISQCSNISISILSATSKKTIIVPILSAIDYKNLTWGTNSTVIQITNGNVFQDTNIVGGSAAYATQAWGDSEVLAVGNVTSGSAYEGISFVKFDLTPYTSINGTKFYGAQFGMKIRDNEIYSSTAWYSPAIYHVYNSTIYKINGVEWLEGTGTWGTVGCPTGRNGGANATGVLTYNSQPTTGQWNGTYESFNNITSATANGTWLNWTATNMVATELNSGGKNITIKIQGAYVTDTLLQNFNCTLFNSSEATTDKPYLNITYEQDSIAPDWSLNSTNTTVAGSSVLFSLFWHDLFNATTQGNLSSYIFSWSNGGNWSWSNQTTDLESGTQTVRGSMDLYEGFENSFLPIGWTTGGTGNNWFRNSTNKSVGTYCAESGYTTPVTGNVNSWINVSQTYTQAGSIVFDWRVSSENNYDWLRFTMDNTTTACTDNTNRISGTAAGWATKTFTVAAGTHWFTWCYSKDANTIGGNDAAWIDNVTFVNRDNPINSNSSYVTYNTINNDSVLNPILSVTVTVNVSSYNKYGSMNNSNSYPDLWLEIYNGSAWVELGNMSITGTGNFSNYTTIASILNGWQTASNRNIRIKGILLDQNSSTIYDEINWTAVWVTINSTSLMLNDSSVAFPSTTNVSWSNVTKTINSTVGAVIKWCVYGFDSALNINSSSCTVPFNFTTTSGGGATCGIVVYDYATYSELAVVSMNWGRILYDAGTYAELQLRNLTLTRVFYDYDTYAELLITSALHPRTFYDSVTYSELQTKLSIFPRVLYDSVTYAEDLVKNSIFGMMLYDYVTYAESVIKNSAFARMLYDLTAYAESIIKQSVFGIVVYDYATYAENVVTSVVTSAKEYAVYLYDSAVYAESVLRGLALSINIYDAAAYAENMVRGIAVTINIYDSMAYAENLVASVSAFVSGVVEQAMSYIPPLNIPPVRIDFSWISVIILGCICVFGVNYMRNRKPDTQDEETLNEEFPDNEE